MNSKIYNLLITVKLATASSIALSSYVHAESLYKFSIPSQQLDASLRAVGAQTDTNILFDPGTIKRRVGVPLNGSYSVSGALDRLLQGTGLRVKKAAGSSLLIVSSAAAAAQPEALLHRVSRQASSTPSVETPRAPAVIALESIADTAPRLEEIVVTAQKRRENLQKVPIAVSAISGEALEARGITSVVDLAESIPGLQIHNSIGIMQPFLRGVGSTKKTLGNESSVAVYADGVYYTLLPSAFFDLNNVERVEVLKGPQGTLFGRNSTGGVINIVTKDPSQDTKVKGSLGYGRFEAYQGNLYATTGLGEKAAIDISLSAKTDDGFGRNLPTGHRYGYEDSILARSKLLLDPTETTRLLLSAFYSWSEVPGEKAAFPGTATTTVSQPAAIFRSEEFGFYNAISDTDQRYIFRTWGVSLKVDQDLSFARLTSISAYNFVNHKDYNDGDIGPRPDFYAPFKARAKTLTQEFQLASLPGSGLDWIMGLFYYNNLSRYYQVELRGPLLFGPGIDAPSYQKSLSYAAYAQATYEIAPRLKLTGGLRYTSDKTSAFGQLLTNTDPPVDLSGLPKSSSTVRKVTFRGAVDYQLETGALFYASFSRGFKSGSYNILTYNSTTPTKPEGIDAYEVGFKSDMFDRRLRINGAAFYYNITSPQVQTLKNGTILLSNAGKSRVKGAEIEGQLIVTDALRGRFSAQYLDSKYKVYADAPGSIPDLVNGGAIAVPPIDAAGNRTPLAAKLTFGIGADYVITAGQYTVTLTTDYYHNSGYYYEPDNFLHQKAYDVLNGQIKIAPSERLAIRLWGKNLTDEKYTQSAQTQLGNAGYIWTPAPPRTYGVALDFTF